MKPNRFFILLALLGVAASFIQCGDDPPPAVDPQDQQLENLSKPWKATSVTLAVGTGTAQPVIGYENFVLTMSGTAGQSTFNYTTSGRPSGTTPWADAGTFTFGTDFSTVVERDDGTIITYTLNSDVTQLQITFNYTGAGYTSRTSSVQGNWTFTFGL